MIGPNQVADFKCVLLVSSDVFQAYNGYFAVQKVMLSLGFFKRQVETVLGRWQNNEIHLRSVAKDRSTKNYTGRLDNMCSFALRSIGPLSSILSLALKIDSTEEIKYMTNYYFGNPI
jgi:hypothetical protein